MAPPETRPSSNLAENLVVAVGRHTLELSSLDKTMYPESGITKAEVIAYYHSVANVMLRHVGGRALSLVRYPEGIREEGFFQKRAPDWTPSWIRTARLGGEAKDYVLATEPATLVWLANQAALEMHAMNVREPHLDRPDHLAFDLDPPEDRPFSGTVELAGRLRSFLESHGYQAFVKTSGKKGLHIVVPIEQQWSVDVCYEAAKDLATQFVRSASGTTLNMSRQRRRGRTLVDVVRNAPGQTTVAPYSLRSVPGAPVSCPLSWDEVEKLTDPSVLNIATVQERLDERGDAWRSMDAFRAPLHTQPQVPASTSPSLSGYADRRDFDRTPEPPDRAASGSGRRFVLHRHRASRLHYDLRIEEDGVLRSWALPRGLPPRPGVRRLAVPTEDHPVGYLTFEGDIPKDQYGGGRMWIFASGRYDIMKRTSSSRQLRLYADGLDGEYRLYRTDERSWMIERLDEPRPDLLRTDIEPMAPATVDHVPQGIPGEYLYEVKWDGVRVLVAIEDGRLRLTTRNGLDVTEQFPELRTPDAFDLAAGVLDGEVVLLGEDGKPDFASVVSRLHLSDRRRIERAALASPVHCMLFDCLYLDGRAVVDEPLSRRREWLADVLRQKASGGPHRAARYQVSAAYADGFGLWDTMEELALEGIVSKRAESRYVFGGTHEWLKTKRWHSDEFLIVGFTPRKAGGPGTIGALHLAAYVDGHYLYRGKVGSGLTERDAHRLREELQPAREMPEDLEGTVADDPDTTWVVPSIVCEVSFAHVTREGRLRKPVFLRTRPDVSALDYVESRQEVPS